MNKKQLVKEIVSRTDLTYRQALVVLNTFLAEVKDQMQGQGTVKLLGFGSFSVKLRAARSGRNPRTLQRMVIQPSKQVHFKASKVLMKRIASD